MKRFLYIVLLTLIPLLAPTSAYSENESGVVSGDVNTQAIPFKKNEVFSEKNLLRTGIVSMLGVLVAFGVLIVIKRYVVNQPAGVTDMNCINLRAVKRLTPKLMLFVVCVDNREYLILQSGDRVAVTKHRENIPAPISDDE